ncbi:hypothetical protein F4823DRAFT_518232 [Ustulina deusta]|nr:hypothetical protein F4823DRAFT_518232 [Ustulina deusta]
MAASNDNQVMEKQLVEKKPAEKKGKEKKATDKIRKNPNRIKKRGQPTSAARLISSPYIKFGWHKPLLSQVKEVVQGVSSIADSMYMLQIERERPIESLSLRNGLFWEHRQLVRQSVLSTPAVDHLDLFPDDDELFQDTLQKIGKKVRENEKAFGLHYLFGSIRSREFLLLPVEIDGNWITIIARIQRKAELDLDQALDDYADMEITDFAFVDPLPEGRESRQTLVHARFFKILEEGCIEPAANLTDRKLAVPDIDLEESSDHRWQTGLIAYAISREFIRRLKMLQYRQDLGDCSSSSDDCDFLWAPFEEHYNFDAYRQSLMAACAHQCIEGSAYKARLALEVPSDDSNYHRELLGRGAGETDYLAVDEKFEVFQSETHTHAVEIQTRAIDIQTSLMSPSSKSLTPEAQGFLSNPELQPEAERREIIEINSDSDSDSEMETSPDEDQLPIASANAQDNVPVAPMGEHELSPRIPGLRLLNSVFGGMGPNTSEAAVQKRALSDDDDDDEGMPSPKNRRVKMSCKNSHHIGSCWCPLIGPQFL